MRVDGMDFTQGKDKNHLNKALKNGVEKGVFKKVFIIAMQQKKELRDFGVLFAEQRFLPGGEGNQEEERRRRRRNHRPQDSRSRPCRVLGVSLAGNNHATRLLRASRPRCFGAAG